MVERDFLLISCPYSCVIHDPRFAYFHIEAEIDGRHFPDGIFKCIFLKENMLISIKILLEFVPKG